MQQDKLVPIRETVAKCVEMYSGALKGSSGFIYNGGMYNDKFIFQFLKFPDCEDNSGLITVQPNVKVRLIEDEEFTGIVEKYGEHLVTHAPIRGCAVRSKPEVFTLGGDGTILPAFKFLVEECKSRPFHFGLTRGAAYWNGFQAKFVTDTWASAVPGCLSLLVDDVRCGLKGILLRAREIDPTATLTWKSVLDIPNKTMEGVIPKYRSLRQSPSRNVYSHTEFIQVDDPPFRFASCPLYFGIDQRGKGITKRMVKALDAMVGVISVLLFKGMEDERRRAYCGRAGEFISSRYGIEYRTLSSAMLAHPVLFHIIVDLSRVAAYMPISGLDNVWKAEEESVVETINSLNFSRARAILKVNESILIKVLEKLYGDEKAGAVLRMIRNGALSYFNDLHDMKKAWRLEIGWESNSESENCSVKTLKR